MHRDVRTGAPIDRIGKARGQLEEAADAADSRLQEQLGSLDEGLEELVHGEATREGHTHRDRLVEVEQKLADLRLRAEGRARLHVEAAMRLVVDYRRTHEFEA